MNDDILELLKELGIQAKALGFNYVDIYVPNKKTGEVIAITFSKSEKYIQRVSEIEAKKQ